jgi:hypothetical protein
MDSPTDPGPHERRGGRTPWIVGGGALVAIVVGVLVAMGLFRSDPGDDTPPPAAEGGLKVELTQVYAGTLDPDRPLRCFVGDQMVGELTVAQCAQRNGVAAQALDVGLDASGALTAVVSAAPPLNTEPLGEAVAGPEPVPDYEGAPAATPAGGPVGECARETASGRLPLSEAATLETCVRLVFSGRCEQPGGASYGAWRGQSLRLSGRRVELEEGAGYRVVAQQDSSCSFP